MRRLRISIKFTVVIGIVLTSLAIVGLPDRLYAMSDQTIISLVNTERQKAGLHPLIVSASLQRSSYAKGADMMSVDYWSHNAPDGSEPWHFFEENGYMFTGAGENLAKSFSTPAGVVKGWMDSPTHKANVLGAEYKEIGIAAIDGTLLGEQTTLIVAHFGARSSSEASDNLKPATVWQPEASNSLPETPVLAAKLENKSGWKKFLNEIQRWFEPRPVLLSYDPRLNGLLPLRWM